MSEILRSLAKKIHLWIYLVLMFISLSLIYSENLFFQHKINRLSVELTGILNIPGQLWSSLLDLKKNNNALLNENAQLQEKLFKSPHLNNYYDKFRITPAHVVARYTHGYNNYIIIDKGSKDGLQPNQGVWTPQGVGGIISDVSAHFAKVYTLFHPDVSLSVQLESNGDYGFTTWNKNSRKYIRLTDFPDESIIKPGDTVYTSGMSLIFPKGIPVGKVVKVKHNPGQNPLVEIEPVVDINHIQNVYIGFHPYQEELKKMNDEN